MTAVTTMTAGRSAIGRVLAVAAFGALLLLGAGPASAHTQLVSSEPADGAVLSVAPAQVTFTFDEQLIPGTDTISVNDADGAVVWSTEVTPEGRTLSAPWPAAASTGAFQVAYRVVSDDGHPVSGAIAITIGANAGTAPSAPASATAAAPVETPGIAAGLVILVVLVALALIVAVVVVLVRRRSL